jgi:DNA invertase Pin-like site-specific DNA recombinase
LNLGAKRVCVSRKSVPKRKAGIPLDELPAAHAAGDDRLKTLMGRYSGSVVPASTLGAKPAKGRKPTKKGLKKALGARLARLDDSEVVPLVEPRLVGYARVSTDEQTTALQLDALRIAGCAPIHEDSASGASRSRPGLSRALEDLAAGDTLVVWRLDRLGRSLRDLLDISERFRERDVALRSLTDHIDTGTAAGRMLYAVLGAVAQFERDVLRERTVAGMRAAKKRGEHIGRPSALTPTQVREAKKMRDRGESPNHIARVLRVGRSTLYRAIGQKS